jgi:hypothetical protein
MFVLVRKTHDDANYFEKDKYDTDGNVDAVAERDSEVRRGRLLIPNS